MKKKLIVLSGFVMGLAPVVALAQVATGTNQANCTGPGTVSNIEGLLCKIGDILSAVVPILIIIGVIYFVWGVVSYVIGKDEEAKKEGRSKIIYGIIGLAVIVSVWGLVKILTNTFVPSQNTGSVTLPTISY